MVVSVNEGFPPLPVRRAARDPVSRTGSQRAGAVARIRERTPLHGETSAADALGELRIETLQFRDPRPDPLPPSAGEARPVGFRWGAIRRQARQLGADLLERQSHPLREHDERDPAKRRAAVPPMSGLRPLRRDQATLLVVSQRGNGDPAASRHLPDRQEWKHRGIIERIPLDLNRASGLSFPPTLRYPWFSTLQPTESPA